MPMRRVLIFMAALIGVVITASLGHWQLDRAAKKQALVDERRARETMAPLDGDMLGRTGDTAANRAGLLYRPVALRGRWLAKYTVYLDNRQMLGRAGFYVVTPLELKASGVVILVQRGWVPRSFSEREKLPEVITSDQEVEVHAHLAPWPSRMYEFATEEHGPIRQNLDLEVFKSETGLPLLEISAVETGPASQGLLREWPLVASGIEKHQGYAFQWFGLCAMIALLYVWFQIVQPRRKHPLG